MSPSKLTPVEKTLCLIDIGYFINNSGPPLLKPERSVDVIIALDYDMGVPFKVKQKCFLSYFLFDSCRRLRRTKSSVVKHVVHIKKGL